MNLRLLASTYAIIFVAEWGGLTRFSTARSRRAARRL
jgi:hypothetical protein